MPQISDQGEFRFRAVPPFSLLSGRGGLARRLRGFSMLAVAVVALLVAAGVVWVLMVDAQDATVQLVKNTGQTDASPYAPDARSIAQRFTTGPNPHGYPLDQVMIEFGPRPRKSDQCSEMPGFGKQMAGGESVTPGRILRAVG